MSSWERSAPVAEDSGMRGRLAQTAVAMLAAAIFLIDTFSPLDMAIAVLYVVVVLIAAGVAEQRGLLLIGGTCIALTLLSFAITHTHAYDIASTMRCVVSLAAVSVTTLLSLRNQEATRALREKAELLDLSHDAVFVRAPDDTITYWNRGAEELYGWSRHEAIGQPAAHLLRTRFPAPRAAIRAELLRTGRWDGELLHTRRDGGLVTALSRWSLRRDERGRPAATMETNSDITSRKRAEDELHQAQADLAHVTRVATMGELTASIAHEVNQPLAAVVTNGEACLRWLGRAVPDLGEAEATVRRMIADARRASEVVARLRALARRAEPEHLPLDAAEMVEDALTLIERELSNHHVRLEAELPAGLPPVPGDRVQLQQVVINLALNAIQAMDAVPEERRRLAIGIAPQAPEAEGAGGIAITIADTGPGVDEAALPVLFDAFYTTKRDGIGLGLSISRSIVEAHGGRIAAAREATGGLRFTLTLPAAEDRAS
ncbi:ATP-binding protein [Xanthobacter sp. V2C-8]|uniref:two-component system sensor histidine kinase NtrB n=1 Tax=Xanthobacter albus TaxID=3119929 RepID=UPI003726389C